MSSNTASNQKLRLKQELIDNWSTREKLCLASSVQRSGDQNWSTVSRSLKAFAEQNRPKDWFNQKYCALQYQDLLEKIEKEIPKRKRGERGEEIAEDLIVRKLTNERIEELRVTTAFEREMINKMKADLESLRNNSMDEKRYKEIVNQIKDKERAELESEIEHKKWLEERDLKIAQMKARRGLLHTNRQKAVTPLTPATPPKQILPSSITASEPCNAPLSEPLKVNIDSDPPTTTQTSVIQTNENKLTLPLPTPSTSPLLTSLLQSPTPSTPTILSPNKSGLSSTTFTRQTSTGVNQIPAVSSPTIPSIPRRPSIHSSPEKLSSLNSPEKTESAESNANVMSPVISGTNMNASAQQINPQSTSPTLSKLLEMSPSADGKVAPLPAVDEQTVQQIEQNQESEQTQQVEEPKEAQESSLVNEEIRISSPIKSPTKTNLTKQDSETSNEIQKDDELIERLPQNVDQIDESNNETNDKSFKKSAELTNEDKATEIPADNIIDESVEAVNIKREIIEPKEAEKEYEKEIPENITIKQEPTDLTPNIITEDPKPSPSVSTRAKRKKPPTPVSLNITPTITRRSGRVKALRDSKTTTDDSTEVSDQSAANTPQAAKQRASVDDTTETSMSEESMDAKAAVTVPLNESLPNSPASSIMQTEETENLREYKIWKKAIMLVWRTASTHKNASLFLHPVTESDAEGYTDIVRRSMDLTTIKKRIENGVIRTTAEFQRDIMLMFQNAIMFNNAKHDVHKMAVEMQKETIASIEDFIETQQQNNQSNESKLRGRERRSTALLSPLNIDTEISGRRKSRGASTDTDSGSTVQSKSAIKKKKA